LKYRLLNTLATRAEGGKKGAMKTEKNKKVISLENRSGEVQEARNPEFPGTTRLYCEQTKKTKSELKQKKMNLKKKKPSKNRSKGGE